MSDLIFNKHNKKQLSVWGKKQATLRGPPLQHNGDCVWGVCDSVHWVSQVG